MHQPAVPSDAIQTRRAIAIWLFACAAMVFVMVVLGGVTRLTESGLSIVDWRPVTGILPPLSEAEWRATFDQYRESPEFRRGNFWMTLDDFKGIFWLEYLHRLWGRAIGVAFLLPFLYFLARGRIERRLIAPLGVLFLLGAAQGFLGWYMVKSGLVDEPSVSQYRLAAHLGLAVLIYGFLLWLAFGLWSAGSGVFAGARRLPATPTLNAARKTSLAGVAVAWSFVTLISGAFVAGLDAGLAYNTFPLMDGRIVPEGIFTLSPWPVNFFQNTATVQFTHRALAIGFVVYAVAVWGFARCGDMAPDVRRALGLLALIAVVQAGLGISTLLTGVPVALAALHQAGAIAVFSAALWAAFIARRPVVDRRAETSVLDAATGAR